MVMQVFYIFSRAKAIPSNNFDLVHQLSEVMAIACDGNGKRLHIGF